MVRLAIRYFFNRTVEIDRCYASFAAPGKAQELASEIGRSLRRSNDDVDGFLLFILGN